MKRIISIFVSFSFLLSLTINSYAISPIFTQLTVENGLSANHVKSILLDIQGFIWFGTVEGLNRFDGYEILTFSEKFPSGSQNINCLLDDSQHNFWIGTERGLFVRKKGSVDFSLFDPGFISLRVTCLVHFNSGKIGIGTDQGLLVLNPETGEFKKILFAESISSQVNHLTGMVTDENGKTWISTHNGLIFFQDTSGAFEIFKNAVSGKANFFTCITRIKDDIYLGTRADGLFRFELHTDKFSRISGLNNQLVLSVAPGQNDKLFVGTDGGGLNIVDTSSGNIEFLLHDPDDPATIGSNSVYSIFESADGRLWLGTFSAGVSQGRSKQLRFNTFSSGTGNQLLNKSIRSLNFGIPGVKILGTRDGLFSVSENDNNLKLFRSGYNAPGLRTNIILAIRQYRGNTLLGTYGGGVSRFDLVTHQFSQFNDEPDFKTGCFYGFQEDSEGKLWMATLNGLYCFNPSTDSLSHYITDNSKMISNEVFSILFDSSNRLWVGTMQGISVFTVKNGHLIPVNLNQKQSCNFKVNYIYEDSGKNIWVCTESGGLFRGNQDLQSYTRYSEGNGLPSNSICAMVETSPGVFWISTLKGLCRMEGEHFDIFTISDGLPGLAFTPAAVNRTEDGNLWFGNEQGLVFFHPDSIKPRSGNVPLVITDFYLFGKKVEAGLADFLPKPVEITSEIRLKQKQNSIGFRFVALNFDNPADQYYECQLTGLEKEWRLMHGQNEIFYENLKPGSYTFQVRQSGITANSGQMTRQLNISVRSVFYKHPLFIIVILLTGFWWAWKIFSRFKTQTDEIHRLEEKNKPLEKYRHSKLAVEETQDILSRLKLFMETDKPFLDSGLKLANVAGKMEVSVHEVSQAVNQSLHQSFSDYINHYRIREVKERMADPRYKRLTLFAVAQECGFSSKTSFYRIFKKETGQTPAEYMASLKQE